MDPVAVHLVKRPAESFRRKDEGYGIVNDIDRDILQAFLILSLIHGCLRRTLRSQLIHVHTPYHGETHFSDIRPLDFTYS